MGLPDILEDSRGSLDLVVSGRWRGMSLKVSAENLTDEAYDFVQGGLSQRSYKLGRVFQFNVGLSAF